MDIPQQPESVERSPLPRRVPDARWFSSEELLAGAREVLIRHGEETYRLRLTRSGKLLLQK